MNRVNICILFGQVADKEKGALTLSSLSTAGVHLSEPLFLHLTSRKNTHPTYVQGFCENQIFESQSPSQDRSPHSIKQRQMAYRFLGYLNKQVNQQSQRISREQSGHAVLDSRFLPWIPFPYLNRLSKFSYFLSLLAKK